MSKNDEAYEIKYSRLLSDIKDDRMRRVEAVQTKTLTFFQYVYSALHRGHEAVIEFKIFVSREDAEKYWNKVVGRLCDYIAPPPTVEVTV